MIRRTVIRIVALEGTLCCPALGDPSGLYVASYDPEAHDGYGEVGLTRDAHQALSFVGPGAARAFYLQASRTRPRRSDGRPNRPMTAFTVAFEFLPTMEA